MILDGQHCLASPVSPLGERREVRLVPIARSGAWLTPQLALARADEEPSWHVVVIRVVPGAQVLLGALADQAGHVREWLEIWIQLPASSTVGDPGVNNAGCDARWTVFCAAMAEVNAASVLHTHSEMRAPRPLWVDTAEGRSWPAADGGDDEIELCTDEVALAAAGLPSYAASPERHLWRRGRPGDGFFQVAGGVPQGSRAVPAWAAPSSRMLAVNPHAGRLLVRRHAPLDLDSYADFLSGRGLGPVQSGSLFVFQEPVNRTGLDACDQLQQAGAFMLPTTRGLAGRFLETFHLKLLLLAQAVRGVQTQVAVQQLPMLNLCAASFRVDFCSSTGELPILWSAKAMLCDASAAEVIPLPSTERRSFRRAGQPSSLIYSAPNDGPAVRGEGRLRIRRLVEDAGRRTLHATLETDECLPARDSDLVCLELPVPGKGLMPVYGRLCAEEALNQQERRFESYSSEWPPDIAAALTHMGGQHFPHVRFSVVAQMGARHDLYSLGVLGARLLLTHPRHTLGEAVDDLLSLARALARSEGASAADRALALALSDARWHAALGPQHHGHGCATADEGYRWIPMELWWNAVATLARFFPGAGVFSHADDFNDSPDVPVSKAFDEPLRDLDRLILHSRSLLLSDWLANREVARVLQRIR